MDARLVHKDKFVCARDARFSITDRALGEYILTGVTLSVLQEVSVLTRRAPDGAADIPKTPGRLVLCLARSRERHEMFVVAC